jgi:hypothetical protein
MSFRGKQVIKGMAYIFEAIAQWDAEKQQFRQKCIYIGKKDPVTGAFLPNKKYYKLYGEDASVRCTPVLRMKSFIYVKTGRTIPRFRQPLHPRTSAGC